MDPKKMSVVELKKSYPDEPWHWRPEWHTRLIKYSGKSEAVVLGLMGVVFFGLSIPALTALPREFSRGNYALLLVLLFTLMGLGLMYFSLKGVSGGASLWHPDLQTEHSPRIMGRMGRGRGFDSQGCSSGGSDQNRPRLCSQKSQWRG
jgi:hypothetical protein